MSIRMPNDITSFLVILATAATVAGWGIYSFNANTDRLAENNLPACKAHFAEAVANPEDLCLKSFKAAITGTADIAGAEAPILRRQVFFADNPPVLLFTHPGAAQDGVVGTYDPAAHAFTLELSASLQEQRQALVSLTTHFSDLNKRGLGQLYELSYDGEKVSTQLAATGAKAPVLAM